MAIRFIVVDDHASFRATALALLVDAGFDVVGEAEDGAQALALVHELRPDALLLDVQLPDMDGFEIANRLGANGSTPAIILTSSRDISDYGTLVADSGARGFIPKADLSGAAIAALIG